MSLTLTYFYELHSRYFANLLCLYLRTTTKYINSSQQPCFKKHGVMTGIRSSERSQPPTQTLSHQTSPCLTPVQKCRIRVASSPLLRRSMIRFLTFYNYPTISHQIQPIPSHLQLHTAGSYTKYIRQMPHAGPNRLLTANLSFGELPRDYDDI